MTSYPPLPSYNHTHMPTTRFFMSPTAQLVNSAKILKMIPMSLTNGAPTITCSPATTSLISCYYDYGNRRPYRKHSPYTDFNITTTWFCSSCNKHQAVRHLMNPHLSLKFYHHFLYPFLPDP